MQYPSGRCLIKYQGDKASEGLVERDEYGSWGKVWEVSQRREVFKDTLRAFSSAIYEDPDLEYSGRILLPEVALNAGAMTVDNQGALFSLRNPRLGNEVYAGVKSFTARPGHVRLPHWMIQFLQIEAGDTV